MEYKMILIGIVLLSSLVLSLSLISANELQNFLDSANITVTIKQNESWVNFSFDTSKWASFDHQEIMIQNETIDDLKIDEISLSFDISKFLRDINAEIEIQRDSNTPQFNNLNVTANDIVFNVTKISVENISITDALFTTKGFLTNVLNQLNLGLNLNNVTTINDYLKAHPPKITSDSDNVISDRHVIFTKIGDNYRIWNDEGYGNISEDWKEDIRDAIKNGVESVSLKDIFDEIMPFLEENGLDSIFNGFDTNYSVTNVNLSSINTLEDGNYVIPVTITASDGSTYKKNINLVIQGIQNIEIDNSINETYIPKNPEVAYYLIKISGLKGTINVSLFDTKPPASILPSNVKRVIKYIDIDTNSSSGGTIDFKVPTISVVNPLQVGLYVLEGNSWISLPTAFLGELTSGFYHYSAVTPHFSTFMIMETTVTSGGGDKKNEEKIQYGGIRRIPGTSTTPTNIPEPLEATPTPKAGGGITGAIIGVLTSPTGLAVLVFVLIGIVIVSLLIRNFPGEKNKKQKRGEINEKSDDNGL